MDGENTGAGGFDLSQLLQMAGPMLSGYGMAKGNPMMMAGGLLPLLMQMQQRNPQRPQGAMMGIKPPMTGLGGMGGQIPPMAMPPMQTPNFNPSYGLQPMGGSLGFQPSGGLGFQMPRY
jgi:hypothetical protein